jgi:hypothetical protein
MSSMWDRVNVDYRQLLPSQSGESVDSANLGVYEDDESRAQTQANGSPLACPEFCNFLPDLSWRERLLGCATCMICGYLLSFGSFMRMKDLVGGNPVPLVINVTMGNVLALCGSFFLTGPTQQIQRMWHETRRIATVMYLGSLSLTFILLLTPHHKGKGLILFLLMIFQYVAITWYVTFTSVPPALFFRNRMDQGVCGHWYIYIYIGMRLSLTIFLC